jgi:5-deoxy-glucuronate isomerase
MIRKQLLYRSARVAPGRSGVALDLSVKSFGWNRIHFAVRQLAPGVSWAGLSRQEERCLVLLRGFFEVSWSTGSLHVGPRADVFSGYPHAVYLPRNTAFRVVALEACEIADCRAPAARTFEARLIRPQDCGYEIRGGGNATRQIVDIMPPGFPAERLMLCEVYTPSGNWSSYPPHKHDTDNPPREVDLEEVYYFRYKDADGYGFQRLYNGRRDETLRVAHGDVVAVRDGFHPFVTAYGYDAYYLNVLAGDHRSMAASEDPR